MMLLSGFDFKNFGANEVLRYAKELNEKPGLIIFYNKYADNIDDKYLIKKLSMAIPTAIRDLFENYANKLEPDRKYLKTFSEIHNKSKRTENRIDYI